MKKGFSIFLPMVTVIAFLMLVYAAYIFTVEKPLTLTGTIGDLQLKLLDRYQKGEKAQLFIDYGARFSAYKALNDFASYGGLNYDECYDYINDYSIWNSSCKPYDNITDNFFSFFVPYFNTYLDSYELYLPESYDFSLNFNKNSFDVIGNALEDTSLDIGLEEKKSQFKPDIKAEEVPYTPKKEDGVLVPIEEEKLPPLPKIEEKLERVKPKESVQKPGDIDVMISEAADKNKIDKIVIKSLIYQESRFKTNAISPVGAAGLMQLMPHTAQRLGMRSIYLGDEFSDMYKKFIKKEISLDEFRSYEKKYSDDLKAKIAFLKSLGEQDEIALIDNRFDPEENINAGTAYFAKLLKLYNGDLRLALVAYNAGPGYVDRNCKSSYNNCIFGSNKETPNFVFSIVNLIANGGPSITTAAVSIPVKPKIDFNKVLNYNILFTYYIRGSFKQKINYDFSDYKPIFDEVTKKENLQCLKDIETDLINKKTNELSDCIKDKHSFNWDIKKESDRIFFEVLTDQKIINLKNEFRPLTIRFEINPKDFP